MGLRLRTLFKTDRSFPMSMDIGSNDSCLIEEFRKVGINGFGIEPSQQASKMDFERTIVVVNEFWSHKLSKRWSIMGKHRDFITATNVFAHVDNLNDFLLGVKEMLLPNGVFVVEVPYLVDLVQNNAFDTIYHEHLSYFLLKPLVKAFKQAGLKIFRVERYPIHCGTIRVYASKNAHEEHSSVKKILNLEKSLGMYEFKTYQSFALRVEKLRGEIVSMVWKAKLDGDVLAGYGASAKGISLLNYCGITKYSIKYVVDDSPAKQGKFMPGSGIEISDFSRFQKEKPDYILLFAWNFLKEMHDKIKGVGAKCIVPIPKVKVI